jgi:hypothetical protein
MSDHFSNRPCDPVPHEIRPDFISQLWPEPSPQSNLGVDANWDAFFMYYERECRAALANGGRQFGARDHRDILRWTNLVSTELKQDETKHKIRADFSQPLTPEDTEKTEKMLDGSIKISARIVAMVNVGALRYEGAGRGSIEWANNESLREAVHNYFRVCTGPLTENITFGKHFTACGDVRIARLGVQWTDNLADHLRVRQAAGKVCIFHHVSFLRRMKSIKRLVFAM